MNRELFELQETDNKITAIKRERTRLDNGEALRSQCQTLAQSIEQESAELDRLNTERAEKEEQLQSAEEKITKQQSRLMNAKNAHEVNSLQRDIEALTRARGDLDEAVLILMDEAESCSGRLTDLEQQKTEKDAELARIEQNFAAETTRLDAALKETSAARAQNAAKLSAVELKKYEDFARRFHGVAVASGQGGNCSACGTAITPYNLKEAKKQEWPTCESCARLLWIG
jgi:predicted  nucleic acid-binding Zn-ribbon protein